MKKICLLLSCLFVVLLLLSGPLVGVLSAQPVTVGKLTAYGDNTLSFDIAWGPAGGRVTPWSDSVWVLIDYKDPASGERRRLPIAGATVTAGQATWPGARARLVAGNTAGFFVDGQARAVDRAATLTVRVTPQAGVTISKPCVYALDYPPLATYGVAGSFNTVALVGTAPFCGIIVNSAGGTMTFPSSEASWTLPAGYRIQEYKDLTGNSGLVDCAGALPTVTGSSGAARCGSGVVTLSATPSAGATIDWYSAATDGTLLLSGNTAYSPSVASNTTYYAQARNTGTQCTSASRTAVVATVNALPVISTQPVAAAVCAGNTNTFTVAATAGSGAGPYYLWYQGGSATGNTTNSFTTATAGNVYAVVSNSNGCSVTSTTVASTINVVPPKPTLTAGTLTVCSGSTTTIALPTDYTAYKFSNGTTAQTANVGAGTYMGQVQSPDSCWSVMSDTVTIASTTCGTGGSCTTPGYTLGTTTWAGCNSTYTTASGTGGAWVFAARPDTYTPFVQWNKPSKAWPVSGGASNWTSGTSSASSWSNGYPCPEGWRLPTQAEVKALDAAGSVWRAGGAKGNAVAGRFYGPGASTCSLPAPTDCIFLPATGFRNDADGSPTEHGAGAIYWGNPDEGLSSGAKYSFTNTNSQPVNTSGKKVAGLAVRCVK